MVSAVKLPVIHFSHPDLKPGSSSWDSVKELVRRSLEEYGCFEASFPKISLEHRKHMFSWLEEVFDLPLQTKLNNTSDKPYHGYIGQYPTLPLYESMGIEGAHMVENVEDFTRAMWPQGNPTFCKNIHWISKQLSELEQVIRRMVLESFGLVETYLEELLEETNYLFRVQKYKAPKTIDLQLGIDPHTDKSFVTILYQNQDGLEVMTKDGDWIKAQCSSDSFVVMIGDSFHAWLNGRLSSPFHRVMMKGEEPRYSIGLFAMPYQGYMVKTPKELVDEEHPLLYKPFEFIEFLSFVYTEQGRKSKNALKDYCGTQN